LKLSTNYNYTTIKKILQEFFPNFSFEKKFEKFFYKTKKINLNFFEAEKNFREKIPKKKIEKKIINQKPLFLLIRIAVINFF